jgi:hypothetical protein
LRAFWDILARGVASPGDNRLELFSAIAHSTPSITGLLSVFTFVSAVPRPVLFNILGVAPAAYATHTRSGGLPPCT